MIDFVFDFLSASFLLQGDEVSTAADSATRDLGRGRDSFGLGESSSMRSQTNWRVACNAVGDCRSVDGPAVCDIAEDGPAVCDRADDGPAVCDRAEDGPAVCDRAEDGPAVCDRGEDGPAVCDRAEVGPAVSGS